MSIPKIYKTIKLKTYKEEFFFCIKDGEDAEKIGEQSSENFQGGLKELISEDHIGVEFYQ